MLRKHLIYTALFVLWVLSGFSQTTSFNNEWIVSGQKYYKIKVAADGLYKLDSAALANAGVPIGNINTKNIQLFQKGKELYPYIADGGNDTLNAHDYILFYAEKNKGKDD
ncbi:MAG TPA: hypothetical protein VKG26_10280, partial [Bacteroidia bacterium]|nr:hypothetical protein [Bacteroidia bacterium]